jgi:hypothetical protein
LASLARFLTVASGSRLGDGGIATDEATGGGLPGPAAKLEPDSNPTTSAATAAVWFGRRAPLFMAEECIIAATRY